MLELLALLRNSAVLELTVAIGAAGLGIVVGAVVAVLRSKSRPQEPVYGPARHRPES